MNNLTTILLKSHTNLEALVVCRVPPVPKHAQGLAEHTMYNSCGPAEHQTEMH